ncbi:MAG: glucose-1-phosphate thymidylyltransferase [Thermomicrobiales bacterium]
MNRRRANDVPVRRRLKGLVLAGGKGSRLRPLTATGAKQLVPIANKPVLFFALEQLVEAGITDICIIVGDTADQVRASVGDGEQFGASITYIPQIAPLGLAHAVVTARDWLGDDPFCMFLGDNFLRCGIAPYVEMFARAERPAMILLKEVEQPSAFGVAVVDGNGRVSRLVEKPTEPISNLAIVGVYFFGPEIHEITASQQPSARGELEITDAVQGLIDAGHEVQAAAIADDWIDTGKKDDVLEANRLVLTTLKRDIAGNADADSSLVGEVVLGAGASVVHSTIRGPSIIGPGARIVDAYVGPFTAIGPDCEITACEIEQSIVLERTVIRNVGARIADSLIGRDVTIEDSRQKPHVVRFMIGDHSVVDLA